MPENQLTSRNGPKKEERNENIFLKKKQVEEEEDEASDDQIGEEHRVTELKRPEKLQLPV